MRATRPCRSFPAGRSQPCAHGPTSAQHPCRGPAFESYAARWPGASLGVALGYAGVIALDVDTEDASQLAAICGAVPPSPAAKTGAKGFTAFHRAPPGAIIPSRHYTEALKRCIADLLSAGTQTVLPPSPHPAGHAYRWLTAATLLTVPAHDLPLAPADIAERLDTALAPWMPRRQFEAVHTLRASPPEGLDLRRFTSFARLVWRAGRASWRQPPRGRAKQRAVRPGGRARQIRAPWGAFPQRDRDSGNRRV